MKAANSVLDGFADISEVLQPSTSSLYYCCLFASVCFPLGFHFLSVRGVDCTLLALQTI